MKVLLYTTIFILLALSTISYAQDWQQTVIKRSLYFDLATLIIFAKHSAPLGVANQTQLAARLF